MSRSSRAEVEPRGPESAAELRLGSPMLASSSSSIRVASGLMEGKSGSPQANDSSGSLCLSRSIK